HLLCSLDEDVAAARGVRTTALGMVFLVLLAVATSVAVQVVGVLLIFALMVTPAAVAQRLVRRPGLAIAASVGLAVAFTWLGLAVAWYTPYPVSFFITAIAFATYLSVRLGQHLATARGARVSGSLP
ncbi:MAG: metal ABC transporter permease, partial [Acidimicrobiales bacterium]